MADPTFDDLYSDLTLAGVSYWEVAYSGTETLTNNSGLTAFTPPGTVSRLRQLIHYVRLLACRCASAASSDPSIRVLCAFSAGQQRDYCDREPGVLPIKRLT